MYALDWLTQRGCSVAPRLIKLIHSVQDGDDMPVPGGWLAFILMERVPGVPLTHFHTYNLAKRDKIRKTFRRSVTELYSHHIQPFDHNPANLIYDENQYKCYFMDFEHVRIDATKLPPRFYEDLYDLWRLDDKKLGLVGR
ncbi:hypothetical protein BDW62DRAFT_185913 [Aspergillus aurantiobrunneus]